MPTLQFCPPLPRRTRQWPDLMKHPCPSAPEPASIFWRINWAHCSGPTVTDTVFAVGVPIKFYLQKQVAAWTWPMAAISHMKARIQLGVSGIVPRCLLSQTCTAGCISLTLFLPLAFLLTAVQGKTGRILGMQGRGHGDERKACPSCVPWAVLLLPGLWPAHCPQTVFPPGAFLFSPTAQPLGHWTLTVYCGVRTRPARPPDLGLCQKPCHSAI